jgi:hypothetical protein
MCTRIVLPPTLPNTTNIELVPVLCLYMGAITNGNACTKIALDYRTCLREFEAESKMSCARESGTQGELFDEKSEGRKSRDTVPFNIDRTF